MADLLRDRAVDRPDDPAIGDEHGRWTWAELDARVDRWVHALRAGGVGAGDRLCLVAGNGRDTFEVLLACVHSGLVVVPVNWHLTAPEIAYLVADSGCRGLVVDADRADTAAAALALVEHPPPLRLVLGDTDRGPFAATAPLLAAAPDRTPADQASGGLMLYTSGTTGAPKGVVNGLLRAGAPLERVRRLLRSLGTGLGVPDRGTTLLTGPWYHSAQLFFSLFPLLRGSRLLTRHRFDPAGTLRLIDAEQVTATHLVPTQFVRMLRLDGATQAAFDGGSLALVWHGGGPCPPPVKRRMIEWWGPVLVEYYAATEGGVATLIDSAEWLAKPGSVGRAFPPNEILVVDPDGRPLPPGRSGRVFVRRPPRSDFEYHNAPEKTRRAHLAPGTFTYGDLGHLDEDGYLFLTGRSADTIVTGGVNVYPAEVEAVLLGHPLVRDAAVVGMPDEEFGEQVRAVLEVAPGAPTGPDLEAELDRFCRVRLAGFKVPRSYEVVPALPRDASGKLRTRLLREPA